MHHAYKRLVAVVLALLILSGTMLSFPQSVRAAGSNIKVTTNIDEYKANGNCSLREAIIAANTNKAVDQCQAGNPSAMDTIYVPTLPRNEKYNLLPFGVGKEDNSLWGDLDIRQSVMIYGDGIGKTIIDGGSLSDRVFQVLNAGDVYFSNLEIRNGSVSGTDVDARGGGIFNSGSNVYIFGVLLDGNHANNTGGNIDNDSGSKMFISRSIIRSGSAGHGGGIYNLGTMSVLESQLTGNLASETGGAIDNNTTMASLTLTNTTIGQNNATRTETTSGGAGIFNEGKLQITNATIARNYGIGMVLADFSTGFIINTILAGNDNGNCIQGSNPIGLKDNGHNLIDSTECAFLGSAPGDKKVAGFAEVGMSGALASNGGQTMTYELLPGSPAIDAGITVSNTTVDQRVFFRPADGDSDGTSLPDIGAFELGATPRFILLPLIKR